MSKKLRLCLATFLAIASIVGPAQDRIESQSPSVPLTTVAKGTISDTDGPQRVVVRTAEEWKKLWTSLSTETPAPTIDFERTVVVGVFLGARPTAGFEVAITAVKTEGGRTIVEYRERRPDPADLVAEVLTSPFHLVSIPRDLGPIEFRQMAK